MIKMVRPYQEVTASLQGAILHILYVKKFKLNTFA